MYKKILWVGVLVVLVAVGYGVVRHTTNANTSDGITIGAILPLTGAVASFGETARNAMLLAASSTASGAPIHIVFEDDHFDPKQTVTAFQKLTTVDHVQAIICLTSAPCSAVAPLAQDQKMPLIAIASAPAISHGRNSVVRLEINPSVEASTIAGYIQSRNYAHIASVVAVQDGIAAGYAGLKTNPGFSSREVDNESVPPDQMEFRTIITKMLAAKPDVMFLGLLPGPAGAFAKEARQLGYHGDFVGMNFIEGAEALTAADGALEGLVYTNASEPQSWFIQKYHATYGADPQEGAAHAYDSILLFTQSFAQSPNDVPHYLRTVKSYSGALGTFSSVGDGEYSIPVALKEVKGGEFVEVQ